MALQVLRQTLMPIGRSASACAAMFVVLGAGAGPAQALDIVFDYSLDSGSFFSAERKSVLEAAAAVFEVRLLAR